MSIQDQWTWSSYVDNMRWVNFNNEPMETTIDDLPIDRAHYVFTLLQNGLLDFEIATVAQIHPRIIARMRARVMFTEIGLIYDFPESMTQELLTTRAQAVYNDTKSLETTSRLLGIPLKEFTLK